MAIDEFQKDVIDRLARIEEAINNDYKALHGNGKPGLLDRVARLETQAGLVEAQQQTLHELTARVVELNTQIQATAIRDNANRDWFTRIRESLGWLVTTIIAIYGAFFR